MTRSMVNPGASTALRRRPQLSDDVADHVRSMIMSGRVRPGEYIRLDETAAELGVSATPVREALSKLRGEGLVESVPHRGYVVNPLTRGDVEDIFWLQGRIAVELARRAAQRSTAAGLDELSALCRALADAVAGGDVHAIAQSEFEFHRRLNQLSDSTKLAWFLHNAVRYTPYTLYASDPDWGEFAVTGHERLIAAMRAGDMRAVEAETRLQFSDGAQRLITHLEQSGMWDDVG
ncbi:MAG: GntR family transcriptional regulator [Tomitella sp.]|nr:GntR family transcriptional regulator [Tomitella sp.]